MGDDPWKRRSNGMKCETCMWFVVKETNSQQQSPTLTEQAEKELYEDLFGFRVCDDGSVWLGGCRLFRKVKDSRGLLAYEPLEAITAHPLKSKKYGGCRRHAPTINGYPVVFTTDWCGDHKLNEEAL